MKRFVTQFQLLAWCSPSYPTGAFSYSHGMEWAVESGMVTTLAGLLFYIGANVTRGGGWVETHTDVTEQLVAQNRADWCVAIAPVARMYGLSFLPIAPEEYDFLLRQARRERPAVQAFLEVLRDETTRERICALGMEPADE